ncbi:hypothetical protein PtA15_14A37 [Puccinia triticina]|nr:uncharacterized protein PtA15_14A37 [Puccinia triticina]WAQ91157.1 hypothetical protein PtA15_14A37 [Puccinia triticina]
MAFILLSAYVALLLVFNRSREVQAPIIADGADLGSLSTDARMGHMNPTESPGRSRDFSANIKVHDVSREKIERIHKAGFKQLTSLTTPDNFDGFVLPVMRGNGALYQKDFLTQKLWNAMRSQIENSGTFEAYYAGRLGWDGEYPAEEEPKIIDEKYVNDETWVQFMEAEYPINLPLHTKHEHCYVRGPLTTPLCFEPRDGEEEPEENTIWKKDLQHYIDFINGHDSFGTNVKLTESEKSQIADDLMEIEVDDSFELQKRLMIDVKEKQAAEQHRQAIEAFHDKLKAGDRAEAEKKLEIANAIERPHLERAKRAMLWAVRNITRLVEAKYPGQKFVWFDVNPWIR